MKSEMWEKIRSEREARVESQRVSPRKKEETGGLRKEWSRFLSVAALISLSNTVSGHKSSLTVHDDSRRAFLIAPFCFTPGGTLNLRVDNFNQTYLDNTKPEHPHLVGFIVRQPLQGYQQGDPDLMQHDAISRQQCLLNSASAVKGWVLPVTHSSLNISLDFTDDNEGLYTIIYENCQFGSRVSFDLSVVLENAGGGRLSAGENGLPLTFACSAALFFLAFLAWVAVMARNRSSLHYVHFLMAVLVFTKTVSATTNAFRFQSLKEHGDGFGWTTASHFFTFLKGLMFFAVIALIGSGWSMVNDALMPKMKRLILFILVLQVLVNIATVVVEESPPGTEGWLAWRDLLHLADILCCCGILFPIVWSIRQMRETVLEEGKSQLILRKLKVFREFYVLIVCYIYFTRVALYLLTSMAPCKVSWVMTLTSEVVTLLLFLVVGYKFRPMVDNEYLRLDLDIEEVGEGQTSTELEMSSTHGGREQGREGGREGGRGGPMMRV